MKNEEGRREAGKSKRWEEGGGDEEVGAMIRIG